MDTITNSLNNLILLRKTLSPPIMHPGWLKEGAIGQLLGTEEEITRMLDVLCWHRDNPRVIFSVPEMIQIFGQQMAALSAAALYLHEYAGVTLEQFGDSYETACGLRKEHTNESSNQDSLGEEISGISP